MEIIIGMTLAFILGAYVRQPFTLHKKVEVITPQPVKVLNERELKEQARLVEQFNNMMSYSGKAQKHD